MKSLDGTQPQVTTIILAGGEGKRFGQNKATLLLMGRSLLDWVIERVEPISHEILVVCGEQVLLPPHFKAKVVPDLFPNQGPLGGLYSGLYFSQTPLAFAFGCDMPFLNLELLNYMLQVAPGFDAVVPRIFGKIHPLHALYFRHCLPVLKRDLKQGLLKLTLSLEHLHLRYLEEEEAQRFDSQLLSFFNINSPADLERASIFLRESENIEKQ